MHYLLFYELGEDHSTRRTPYRSAHLAKAWDASDRGELVLGGALATPAQNENAGKPEGAVLFFQGDSPAVAENFARTDPYVLNGLVKRWYVKEWMTVAGPTALTPIRPS